MPVQGAGYLTALDALADISYQLFEPLANTTLSTYVAGPPGQYVITVGSTAGIYPGAQVVVGTLSGLYGGEVTTVTAVTEYTFTAPLALIHETGDKVFAPTFPVQQPTNPLWTQGEMLAYLSTACNDFLKEVPLAYAIADVAMPPTLQNAALPADCMQPERIALLGGAGPYPLRETSQSNLDGYDYRWQSAQPTSPQAYFRDKVPPQNFGVWPRSNNTSNFEVIYQQRQVMTMGLLDGFLFPDIFVPIVKHRTLSFAYSKDGEARNPGLAKYFAQRYSFAVQVASVVLESISDPNLDPATS